MHAWIAWKSRFIKTHVQKQFGPNRLSAVLTIFEYKHKKVQTWGQIVYRFSRFKRPYAYFQEIKETVCVLSRD